mmetsp:Transcript_23806/g.76876  ORF Transcript_23806/g.76876 Transcript_23806/m.76876 type:complete len:214 (-) Transcript_23806:9-650(-)
MLHCLRVWGQCIPTTRIDIHPCHAIRPREHRLLATAGGVWQGNIGWPQQPGGPRGDAAAAELGAGVGRKEMVEHREVAAAQRAAEGVERRGAPPPRASPASRCQRRDDGLQPGGVGAEQRHRGVHVHRAAGHQPVVHRRGPAWPHLLAQLPRQRHPVAQPAHALLDARGVVAEGFAGHVLEHGAAPNVRRCRRPREVALHRLGPPGDAPSAAS